MLILRHAILHERFAIPPDAVVAVIRFRRIFDLTGEFDRRQFEQAAAVFRAAFPSEASSIDRIERMLRARSRLKFEPILLIAEDGRRRPTGLCFTFFFARERYAYLQYIASDPRRSARGIGGALYEALRELLAAKHARGLFLDVPPDDPSKLKQENRGLLAINRRRIRFYGRYGVRRVTGTLWDVEPNPRNEGYLTVLLYDALDKVPRLPRPDARGIVRHILVDQYGYAANDPYVARIVRSFRAEPVALEPLAAEGPPAPAPAPDARAGQFFKPIKVVWSEGHTIHHLREKGYVERPVRVRAILRGLDGLPIERVKAKHFPERHLTSVHSPHLVTYLKAVCERLSERAIVYPEVFPIRRPDRVPRALEDRAGYFCADTFTPLTHNVWRAAVGAAHCALTAAELLLEGERLAYAICRPPGHHAERRVYGGFCFLNNSALAAQLLSRSGRVALLDVDYHHGNGAQDIFYSRRDVFTLSIHGHPSHAYPNFSGYADERGEGEGAGFNRNYPLDAPVDDARYLAVLGRALRRIRRFNPRFLVISLGFDIMRGDPTGSFAVSTQGLRQIAQAIGAMNLPTLIVQEGGYSVRNLRIGARAFFGALARTWY